VELGAVVVVPEDGLLNTAGGEGRSRSAAHESARPLYSPCTPILGNDALQLWSDRVKKLGVRSLWLASGPREASLEKSVLRDLARQGVEKLLVIKLKSYAEMDLTDLLRFHNEKRNTVTVAQDSRGALGVRMVDRSAVATHAPDASSPTNNERACYQFQGYAKRLLLSSERQDLVRDALSGACAMRPAGTQIRDQLWIEESADVEKSVRVNGPAYVGARTMLRAGVTVGPFSSIERDCVVDCGTTIERSTILPCTYLGPGLLIRHSLVDGPCLEHLDWEAVVDLGPAGLGRRLQSRESRAVRFPAYSVKQPSKPMSLFRWQSPSTNSGSSWVQVQL
jgi:carbonic anhydrase/acetyltransferase-like protein (isoleucine patch superfamily)